MTQRTLFDGGADDTAPAAPGASQPAAASTFPFGPASADNATATAATWWEGPIAGLDFEATGTDPRTARPVSVALLTEWGGVGGDCSGLVRLVDAGVEIPAEATAVHGITTERVRREGGRAEDVLYAVLGLLGRLADQRIPVVIMNARYDWPLLHAEAARHGFDLPANVILLDPGVIDRHVDRWRHGSRRLTDLAAHYGATLDDAHDAAADVRTAIAVTRAIVRRTPTLQRAPLASLPLLQREWFARWRDELNAYWARTGRTDRIRGEWPDGDDSEASEAAAAAGGAA